MACIAVFFVPLGFEGMGEAKIQRMDLPIQIVLLVASEASIVRMAKLTVRGCLTFDSVRFCPVKLMIRRP